MSVKSAETAYPIHELLAERWSPRAFSPEALTPAQIGSLLEAARWSPSAGNGQPWVFIVATREDSATYTALLECLNESNQVWARQAPLLLLAVAQIQRGPDKPNTHGPYDLGQAVANITVQATHLGLYVHQMGGFSADRAREAFQIPPEYAPFTAIAIGKLGDPDTLTENLRERELAKRVRKPLNEFVFSGVWGTQLDLG